MPKLSPITSMIQVTDRFSAGLQKFNKRIHDATAPVRKLRNALHRATQEAGFQRLGKSLGLVKKRLGGVASAAGSAGLRLAAIGGAAAGSIYAMVNATAVAGDKFAKSARAIGMNVEAYQELQFAADRSGISNSEFSTAMVQAAKSVGQLKAGTGSLATLLKKTDPVLAKQVAGTKDSGEAVELLLDAMSRIEDPTKRAAFAAAAFGRSGVSMANLAAEGAGGIAKLREQYRRLGGTISEDAAKASEEFIDAQTDMKVALGGVRNIIGGQLMPQFTALAKKLTEFVVKNRAKITAFAKKFADGLPERIDKIIAGAKSLYNAFAPFIRALSAIIDFIGPANTAFGILAVVIGGKLVMAIAALIPALASLGITIGATPIGWFIGIIAALVALVYVIIKHWSKISGFFSGLWAGIKSATMSFVDWYIGIWKGIWGFFSGLWGKITKTVQDAMGMVGKAIDMLPDWLKKGIQVGVDMATGNVGGAVSGAREMVYGESKPTTVKSQNETRVKVEFANMPKGARVQQEGDAQTDLSMGYAMVTP